MKRIIISCACALMGIATMLSQQTVNGTVVDKQGQPVVGALIQVDGTDVQATTGFDGGFAVEGNAGDKITAKYGGLQARTVRASNDMVITLGKASSLFSWQPTRMWYIGVSALMPEKKFKHTTPGLLIGYSRDRFGFYYKLHVREPGLDDLYGTSGIPCYGATGKSKVQYLTLSLGATYRVYGPVYLYAGAGVGRRRVAWEAQEFYETEYYEIPELSTGVRAICEGGAMLRLGHIMVSGGFTYMFNDKYNTDHRAMGNIAVSYCFGY